MLFRLSKDQGFSSGIAILLLLVAAVGAIGYTSRFITDPDPEMLAFTATSSQRGAILAGRLKNNGDSVIDESGNGLHALERAAAAMQVSLRGFDGYNAVAYGIQTKKLSIPNCAPENVEAVTKLCTTANGADCPEVSEKILGYVKDLATGDRLCLNNAFVALSVIGRDGNLVGRPWVTVASTGPSNHTVAKYNASVGAGVPGGIPAGGPVGVGIPPLLPPGGGGGGGAFTKTPGLFFKGSANLFKRLLDEWVFQSANLLVDPSNPSSSVNTMTGMLKLSNGSGITNFYQIDTTTGSIIDLSTGNPLTDAQVDLLGLPYKTSSIMH